ncbi:hypothetical protein [Candidatus Odyssella thessalonicensis]|uniref:hypothetical protein n=1 Tax=Candidatus Odyssella thessalonicensis TaxID=84647 RepID=UPI000C1C12EB|nr:hypothetical protein [Candidatus Odyssella thessalonicensis]
MIKKISLITVLLWCNLGQAVEFNFEMLEDKAIAFSTKINRTQTVPQETVEKTLSFCLLKGEPYEDRDLYLTEKSVPQLCEEKKYLLEPFKQIKSFFRTCLEIYNKPDLKESKRIALSILLEMVTEKLDYYLWHIQIRKNPSLLSEEDKKKNGDTNLSLIPHKANQPIANNTGTTRGEDLKVKNRSNYSL